MKFPNWKVNKSVQFRKSLKWAVFEEIASLSSAVSASGLQLQRCPNRMHILAQ